MAVAMQQKQQSKAATTTSVESKQDILPAQITTLEQSTLFVKRLLAASISSICYLRNVFPPDCFIDKRLPDNGIVKVLHDGSLGGGKRNATALQLLKFVRGAFDALDKKYLRKLLFGIYTNPDAPDTVLESYSFFVEYGDEDEATISIADEKHKRSLLSKATYKETKHATIQVMRKLFFLVMNLDPLPSEPYLTIKLLYYDDRTPPEYEPPGYQSANMPGFHYVDGMPGSKHVGTVRTNFHSMNFSVRSVLATEPVEKDVENEDSENEPAKKRPKPTPHQQSTNERCGSSNT